MSVGDNIEGVAKSVEGIVKAVPVYKDAIQPVAKQAGKAMETVGKAVNVALAPLKALVWGYEQVEDFLNTKVSEKLKDIPPERIITPELNVAGPLLESLRYTGHKSILREMYANLLAKSMDSTTANEAHPSFVEIIRQITPDEAKIIGCFREGNLFPVIDIRVHKKETQGYNVICNNFNLLGWDTDCEFPQLSSSYLDNLCRLAILEMPHGISLVDAKYYKRLEEHEVVKEIFSKYEDTDIVLEIEKKVVQVTIFGRQFINTVVL